MKTIITFFLTSMLLMNLGCSKDDNEDKNLIGNVEFTFKNFDLQKAPQIVPMIYDANNMNFPILKNLIVNSDGKLHIDSLLIGNYMIEYIDPSIDPMYTHKFVKGFQVKPGLTSKYIIDAHIDTDH